MHRRRLLWFVGLILPVAAGGSPSARAEGTGFRERVVPIVAKYCVPCHGPTKPKAALDLSAYGDEASVDRGRKTWEKVLAHVEEGEMPPEGQPKPSREEVATLTHWLQAKLGVADCRVAADPGRVTMRRLNRAEYNNTIRDLVGIAFRPADDFPLDDVGYGFDNNGDVLTLPPILLEKYLAAAEKIVEEAIVAGDPGGPVKRWEAEALTEGAGVPFEDGRMLASTGEIAVRFAVPRPGEYRLRARAYGQQAGPEPARMAFRVDGKPVHTVDVPAVQDAPGTYEARLRLGPGSRRLAVAFVNDYYHPEDPDPGHRDRNLVVASLELQGPVDHRPPPESHRRILFRMPKSPADRVDCAREILERFAGRAYRRPATAEEVARLLRFVDMADRDGDRFERGIQLAVEAVLLSPHFLFRVEARRAPGADPALNDFELAARLSYFLWSSMPDEELFRVARQGALRDPATLEAQARRMLRDPKARALVENFVGQWLQTRNLRSISPDPARFPAFDDALRTAMRTETELFFEAVVREDRSILDLLDADFTFLNARLARHYGIPGVEGDHFRRVHLADGRRGGVLTQASVLAVTSNPTRTSPVKRGKWVLEQILGTPPPPPPPGVGELREDRAATQAGSLRQRMEAHRTNPDCATCHARMDPLGFGLENFDAIGAWRDRDGDFPIDASGTLPSGRSFRGPAELKVILRGRQPEFARCLAGKVLTYALGRGLDVPDRCLVDRVADALAGDGYRFSRLVAEVVKSDPFRKQGQEDER